MNLTRAEWDAKWWVFFNAHYDTYKSADKAFTYAGERMTKVFGPRPPGEPGLPWWVKISALTLGVQMGPLITRILTALLYAIGVGVAAYQATVPPITVEGWIGLGIAVLVAFWGKFSSNTTVVAANRKTEGF